MRGHSLLNKLMGFPEPESPAQPEPQVQALRIGETYQFFTGFIEYRVTVWKRGDTDYVRPERLLWMRAQGFDFYNFNCQIQDGDKISKFVAGQYCNDAKNNPVPIPVSCVMATLYAAQCSLDNFKVFKLIGKDSFPTDAAISFAGRSLAAWDWLQKINCPFDRITDQLARLREVTPRW